jgi:hypothetical protein
MAVATVTAGDGSECHSKNEGTMFEEDAVGHFSLLYAIVMSGLELNDCVGGWGGRIWLWRKEIQVGLGAAAP